jgi:hypothetical protein
MEPLPEKKKRGSKKKEKTVFKIINGPIVVSFGEEECLADAIVTSIQSDSHKNK